MSDTNSRDEEIQVKGERGAGITSITDDNSHGQRIFRIATVVLIAGLGIGFLYVSWETDKPVPEEEDSAQISPAVPFTPATMPRPQEPTEPAPQPREVQQPAQTDVREAQNDDMLKASIRAPLMTFSANINQDRESPAGGTAPDDFSFDLPPGLTGGQPAREGLRDKLQPTKLVGVGASVLRNLHMVVPQGTSIPCVLQTAVSSDQPGFVSCVIQRDVLSASGQVVLMEKGTTVVGEYDGGLRRGQKRIFVLWNRVRTPRGVIVDMASPGADGLGRTGFDGKIDTHFWERFGGAILMSIVSDGTKYAFDQLTDATEIRADETESAAASAAAIALENSINIPPTLYKNQGELVSIFVARDLDFSSVYDLRVTEGRTRIYDRTVTGDMRAAPTRIIKK